ncbi:MAG: hypothetical protein V4590_03630 [Bacteroidota bacterium]
MRVQIASLCLLLLLTTGLIHAQQPQHVHGFAIEKKPNAWYAQQIVLWKAELDKNPTNGYAWYNYYRATRNQIRLDTTDKRTHMEKAAVLANLVNEMEKAVPQSFEFNLCKWMNGGNDYEHYLPYLKKAAQLGPDRMELISDVLTWAEIERDIAKRDLYAQKWYASPMSSPGLLYYNHNVLAGLKPNAILITQGDNDTYPAWILQSQGIRRDVTVINTSLLNIDVYREKVFKELGIAKWPVTATNSLKDTTVASCNRYKNELVKHLAANNKKYPVYLALTGDDELTKPIADQLYLTGLAYEYSPITLDNIALMKKNFEQVYTLDYIDKPFYQDISVYWSKHCLNNYIVPMIKLYDHYKTSGDAIHMDWMKKKILFIIKGTPEEQNTLTYLNN